MRHSDQQTICYYGRAGADWTTNLRNLASPQEKLTVLQALDNLERFAEGRKQRKEWIEASVFWNQVKDAFRKLLGMELGVNVEGQLRVCINELLK